MKEPIHIDNNTWTLFLDRDGVINKNIDDGYVLKWEQFEFMPGVLETMPKLAKMFPRIIVVSNQQCIGKGLLSIQELNEIHENMINLVELNGGRIDAVYFAPDLASADNKLRKPATGMALLAKKDFPEIDFKKTILVGDKRSDMEFGKALDMVTFYLSNSYNESNNCDYTIRTLSEVLDYVKF
ncbi:MAG: histidinol-phosphate phosphatase family protein [Bacteroidota bacterium]|nr:histidinol-phosphate phosphatase family protein [Bacteroidota bacterium]